VIAVHKFIDKHNLGVPFCYVHPYKQLAVKHLVDNVEDWVEGVIIFGSAVTDAHFYESDVDVCIVGTPSGEFSSRDLRLKGEAYDFVLVESPDMLKQKSDEDFCSVYRDIMEGGVVVYDKKNNPV